MHLISALLSGIRGAENGSAKLWRRGTSTRATWYQDFEATSADNTGDDVLLDENGGAVVYVNELVQVQAYDGQGNLVRDFVAGDQAYAVELISPSFTGADYVTGQIGRSKPTTAGAAFDLWFASAGGYDFQGLYNGSSTSLQNIFGAIYGLFYNVKSPKYGAKGDGTTDDTAAIQAAHDAALHAGGGIVVFPPGIYNVATTLTWNVGVSAFAVPGTAQLSSSSTTASVVTMSGDAFFGSLSPRSTVFYGLEFTNTANNTGANVFVDYNDDDKSLYFVNCRFGGASYSQGVCLQVNSPAGEVVVSGCLFDPRADKSCIRHVAGSATRQLVAENCIFNFPAVACTQPMVYALNPEFHIRDCLFLGSAASGNCVAVVPDVNAPVIITGSHFKKMAAGATNYGVRVTNNAFVQVSDDCSFDAQTTRYQKLVNTDLLASGSYLALQGYLVTPNTAGDPTLIDGFLGMMLNSTKVTAPAVTFPAMYYPGQPFLLTVANVSGTPWVAAINPTAPAGGALGSSRTTDWPTTVGGGGAFYFSVEFICQGVIAGAPTWSQVGAPSVKF